MAIYLKKFENHTQYETYINGSGAILPNVSICTTEGDVHYNPSTPPQPSPKYTNGVYLVDPNVLGSYGVVVDNYGKLVYYVQGGVMYGFNRYGAGMPFDAGYGNIQVSDLPSTIELRENPIATTDFDYELDGIEFISGNGSVTLSYDDESGAISFNPSVVGWY